MIDRDDCTKDGKEAGALTVQQQMLALAPNLRAFAMSICGSADKADDLVQETMLRAITRIDSFQPGTNLGAWLTTILRNCFLSELRKRRYEVEDADGAYAHALRAAPEQESARRSVLTQGTRAKLAEQAIEAATLGYRRLNERKELAEIIGRALGRTASST